MSTPFLKMVGAGNDFLLFDDRDGSCSGIPSERWAALCARRTGAGADGVLLLGTSRDHDYSMRYLNADGVEVEMCGNGARCLAWMAATELGMGRELAPDAPRPPGWEPPGAIGPDRVWWVAFEAGDGTHHAVGWERRVAVSLGDPSPATEKVVETGMGSLTGFFLNVGVPHFVVRTEDPDSVPLSTLGPEIRRHEAFGPGGTNVDLLATRAGADGAWELRTYERGVEAETLSCGTGTCASATVLALSGVAPPVDILTRSGEILRVYFEASEGGPRNLWLEGPVAVVYRGIVAER